VTPPRAAAAGLACRREWFSAAVVSSTSPPARRPECSCAAPVQPVSAAPTHAEGSSAAGGRPNPPLPPSACAPRLFWRSPPSAPRWPKLRLSPDRCIPAPNARAKPAARPCCGGAAATLHAPWRARHGLMLELRPAACTRLCLWRCISCTRYAEATALHSTAHSSEGNAPPPHTHPHTHTHPPAAHHMLRPSAPRPQVSFVLVGQSPPAPPPAAAPPASGKWPQCCGSGAARRQTGGGGGLF
jgi:hypothetical protein